MLVIPVADLTVILYHIASLRPTWATWDPVLKTSKQTNKTQVQPVQHESHKLPLEAQRHLSLRPCLWPSEPPYALKKPPRVPSHSNMWEASQQNYKWDPHRPGKAVHHVIFVCAILYISTRPAHRSLSFDLLNFSPNAVFALLIQPWQRRIPVSKCKW